MLAGLLGHFEILTMSHTTVYTYAQKIATLDTNLAINDHFTPASCTVTHTTPS